ncbi:MAG: Asp-tRNA(Asn)/Glu-tRNA(Gln) amidotransferase subunit GatC [Bacteroidia bacterium]|nr:Asp-tRNA(Asn)/Glu-tRNA(Gln) amidotransferase subunit GatC [Bacteroidia bacterium]NNC86449.1 Asp-tRNA(Asn)/Glu-tRNA(Gln) amidotransferase subunit GatC [Bacteroidia bacterium]NNM16201.1 Asp-tRNA(Asn)/Glu-tRNA(Gln) amidotransferase subunit GatC [Bacteroidia bacterium]
MEVTDSLIDHLANLAKLEFSEKEKEVIKQDLEKMIDFVDTLKSVDTAGVEPLIYMNTDVNVLRDDVVEQTITKEEALKNAPQKDSDYFKVPTVLKSK